MARRAAEGDDETRRRQLAHVRRQRAAGRRCAYRLPAAAWPRRNPAEREACATRRLRVTVAVGRGGGASSSAAAAASAGSGGASAASSVACASAAAWRSWHAARRSAAAAALAARRGGGVATGARPSAAPSCAAAAGCARQRTARSPRVSRATPLLLRWRRTAAPSTRIAPHATSSDAHAAPPPSAPAASKCRRSRCAGDLQSAVVSTLGEPRDERRRFHRFDGAAGARGVLQRLLAALRRHLVRKLGLSEHEVTQDGCELALGGGGGGIHR